MGSNGRGDSTNGDPKPETNFPKTTIITAAQGIQNPSSARHYGRDRGKGRPNDALIANMERFARDRQGELIICAIAGSYVNEIELEKSLRQRDDVRMDADAFARLQAQRAREGERRESWARREEAGKAVGDMPMHFFWDEIPDTEYPDTGERINGKISLIGLPEPPQNQDPLAGNRDLAQRRRGGSVIFPHSKQRLQPVAKDLGWKLPRLVMTTGCCTNANFNGSNRRGRKAIRDHELGFAVVDTIDDKLYLPRLVTARADGSFIDMGWKYSRDGRRSRVKTVALVLGDLHCPRQDPEVMRANFDMIDYFRPRELFIHDLFDGISVSHHTRGDEIERMLEAEEGLDDLGDELELCYATLCDLAKRMGRRKVKVVASNHDDFLRKWLATGLYRGDHRNARLAHKIISQIQRGDWPLEVAIRQVGKIPNNVEFLTLTSDCRPWGVECSAHGHLGPNGARGNLRSLATAYGKVIIGHTHQLEVRAGSVSVGTSGIIPMPYQLGQPSTSMPGNAVIYDGGLVQAFPIIHGEWRVARK